MKKALLSFITAIIIVTSASAQVYVNRKYFKSKDFLDKTTIIPISKNIPDKVRSKYEEVFKKYWTVSSFKIVDFEEYSTYKDNLDFTFFAPVHTLYESTNNSFEGLSLEFFRYVEPRKEGYEIQKEWLGGISMHLNYEAGSEWLGGRRGKESNLHEFVYADKFNDILNLSPGLLKVYLLAFQDDLRNLKAERPDKFQNKEELAKLKSKTLYIPFYATQQVNAFTGKRSDVELNQFFESYTFDYVVLDMEKLSDKIINSESAVYVLIFGRTSVGHYIRIWDANSGKLVYDITDSISRTHNLKSKDIKKIAKAVLK